MTTAYKHYGWQVSYYSGKTRSYLRYKGIPFDDIAPTIRQMRGELQQRVGYTVMPVVVTPDDETLQDTSEIIDWFEAKYPEDSVYPDTPKQRLVSLLFELLGDEWLLLPAMHYRWNFPLHNERFLQDEMGGSALPSIYPHMPRFIQKRLIAPVTGKLSRYCHGLGITPWTIEAIEQWTTELCDQLDAHFQNHEYLLGSRPSIGDYGLIGPFWAHLGRDPYPRETLIKPRPALEAWIERMSLGVNNHGVWLEDDKVPESLLPILQRFIKEFWPILEDTQSAVAQWVGRNPGKKLPRGLGKHEFSIGGKTAERALLPFNQWMAQRPLDYYQQLSEADREPLDAWLRTRGLFGAMQLGISQPLKRRNFRLTAA